MVLVLQIIMTAAGSVAVWLLIGARAYALGAVISTLLFFALMVTSDARTATSTNPSVELRTMPWAAWIALTLVIALALASFWPCVPLIVAGQKIRNATARRSYERDSIERGVSGRASGTDERP